MSIKDNVLRIEETIEQVRYQYKLNQTPQTIVVTKKQSFEAVCQLYDYGYRQFAENRVDALLQRQAEFPQQDIVWHLIGTLQTRKVKDIIHRIDYFHALDRLSLIDEIEKRATKPIKCFLQVNIFNEAVKHGFAMSDIDDVLAYLEEKQHIQVVGLMTMAPFQADEAIISQGFHALADLQKVIASRHLKNSPCMYLSMGMSQDFVLAMQQGATHLRIGSAFFEDSLVE